MENQYENIGLIVSGLFFGASSTFSVFQMSSLLYLKFAEELPIKSLLASASLNKDYMVTGHIQSQNSFSVFFTQSRMSPNEFPDIVYSHYTDKRYNQFNKVIQSLTEVKSVSFNQKPFKILDQGSEILVEPYNRTTIQTNQIYKHTSYFQLTWGQIFKKTVSTLFFFINRLVGIYVQTHMVQEEKIIPVNTVITVVGKLKSISPFTLSPTYIVQDKYQLLSKLKTKLGISVSIQVISGAIILAIWYRKYKRKRREEARKQWYQEVKVDMPRGFQCCVCLENPRDCILSPCNHLVVCQSCSPNVDLCPICRARILERVNIHLS